MDFSYPCNYVAILVRIFRSFAIALVAVVSIVSAPQRTISPNVITNFCPFLAQLRDEFDRGTRTTFDEHVHPHDVAYLLKDFLRSMPEPLLCRSLYAALVDTQSESSCFYVGTGDFSILNNG